MNCNCIYILCELVDPNSSNNSTNCVHQYVDPTALRDTTSQGKRRLKVTSYVHILSYFPYFSHSFPFPVQCNVKMTSSSLSVHTTSLKNTVCNENSSNPGAKTMASQ
jgi:hypothetical protein